MGGVPFCKGTSPFFLFKENKRVCSFEKRTKRGLFIFSHAREKGTKRVRYPQGPLHRGMQPLLLSLRHSCVLSVASAAKRRA